MNAPGRAAWARALRAATLLAVDPIGLGGVAIKAQAGPVRDHYLAILTHLLQAQGPICKLPAQAPVDRLVGGLDLAATLASGQPALMPGLLSAADGGALLVAMAERLPPLSRAIIAHALDTGEVALERDGFEATLSARFGLIALDEGIVDESGSGESLAPALLDRLAFHIDLRDVSLADMELTDGHFAAANAFDPSILPDPGALLAERTKLAAIAYSDDDLATLAKACLGLGIPSMRAPVLTLHAAKIAAILANETAIDGAHLNEAASLVLASRVRRLPPDAESEAEPAPPPDQPEPHTDDAGQNQQEQTSAIPDELVVEAVKAVLPEDVLAALAAAAKRQATGSQEGKAGDFQLSWKRGRPVGKRRAKPGGKQLDVIATLTAAAPWQRVRRTERAQSTGGTRLGRRVEVRLDDLHFRQYRERRGTVMIFVVDASGSAAVGRLAETKGAIELLLARCYVRRDEVALITFRGEGAELLLPPTRSLARAKNSLIAMAGGGGTPLAAGLIAGADLVRAVLAKGQTPSLIVLTDGRANIAGDGSQDRTQAETDSVAAAGRIAALGVNTIMIDTARRSRPFAKELAGVMAAKHVFLPRLAAEDLQAKVNAAVAA